MDEVEHLMTGESVASDIETVKASNVDPSRRVSLSPQKVTAENSLENNVRRFLVDRGIELTEDQIGLLLCICHGVEGGQVSAIQFHMQCGLLTIGPEEANDLYDLVARRDHDSAATSITISTHSADNIGPRAVQGFAVEGYNLFGMNGFHGRNSGNEEGSQGRNGDDQQEDPPGSEHSVARNAGSVAARAANVGPQPQEPHNDGDTTLFGLGISEESSSLDYSKTTKSGGGNPQNM